MFNPAEIHTILSALSPMVLAKGKLAPGARAVLESLISAYGHDGLEYRLITDDQLKTLYSAATNSADQGAKVAETLASMARPQRNPLLRDPPVRSWPRTTTPDPEPPRAAPEPPQSRPEPAGGPYALQRSLDRVEGRCDRLEDVQERDRAGINERIERMARDVTANIAALRDDTADTMRALTAGIQEIVAQAIAASQPNIVHVAQSDPAAPPVNLGIQHYRMPEILQYLMAGENVYLYGPAGSGKTSAARTCAKALGVPFYMAAKVENEFQLVGYTDAGGRLVRTPFREAYENGGAFLFDELDASSPSAVVALNAALANGYCAFPDGMIDRHPDFYCIAAGNTTLTGASRQYQGRNQLDGASVDRFQFLEFGYDEALERAIAPHAGWCKYVQAARKAVADRGLNHLITPRATISGGNLINRGIPVVRVLRSALWKGLDDDTVKQLQDAISVPVPADVGGIL